MQRRQVWWGYFHWPKVIFSHTLNFVPFSIFCSPIFFQGRGMLGHPHFWIIFVALFAYLIMHIHRQRACCFQRALIFIWLLFSVLLDVCRWQSASLRAVLAADRQDHSTGGAADQGRQSWRCTSRCRHTKTSQTVRYFSLAFPYHSNGLFQELICLHKNSIAWQNESNSK